MRTLYLVTTIYIGLLLSGCSNMNTAANNPAPTPKVAANQPIKLPTDQVRPHPKNPLAVTFYTHSKPNAPYTIVGLETISKYNDGGNKRQEATIRDGMRELAAAMGGDAVINIKHDSKSISGTVVAYGKDSDNKQG